MSNHLLAGSGHCSETYTYHTYVHTAHTNPHLVSIYNLYVVLGRTPGNELFPMFPMFSMSPMYVTVCFLYTYVTGVCNFSLVRDASNLPHLHFALNS